MWSSCKKLFFIVIVFAIIDLLKLLPFPFVYWSLYFYFSNILYFYCKRLNFLFNVAYLAFVNVWGFFYYSRILYFSFRAWNYLSFSESWSLKDLFYSVTVVKSSYFYLSWSLSYLYAKFFDCFYIFMSIVFPALFVLFFCV